MEINVTFTGQENTEGVRIHEDAVNVLLDQDTTDSEAVVAMREWLKRFLAFAYELKTRSTCAAAEAFIDANTTDTH